MRIGSSGVHLAGYNQISIIKYRAWRSGEFSENPAADTEITSSQGAYTRPGDIEIHVLRVDCRGSTIGYVCSDTHKEEYEKIYSAIKGATASSDITEYAMACVLPQMSFPTFKNILRRVDRDAYNEGVRNMLRVKSRWGEAESASDLRDVLDALIDTVERKDDF